ncbi:MAG: DUF1207 domain-containing protein [Methylococcaceae bacterium]|nr:DUF1207 domain-containing protein [Methylococcaceae bacterium]
MAHPRWVDFSAAYRNCLIHNFDVNNIVSVSLIRYTVLSGQFQTMHCAMRSRTSRRGLL